MTVEPCLEPYDPPTLNRPSMQGIAQLLVVVNNVPILQGQVYRGEVSINSAAVAEFAGGPLVFIYKAQDAQYMPVGKADEIVEMIIALNPLLPNVKRGEGAAIIRGHMKTMLERFSRNHGEYGYCKAMLDNPELFDQVMRLLQTACQPLYGAFADVMMGIHRR